MKKIIAKILVLCMLSLSFSGMITSHAASSANVTVDSTYGNRGDTVNVAVKLSRNSNLQAFGFNLKYDRNVLELVSATKGGAVASTQAIVNTLTLGKVVFSCVSSNTPITNTGSVLDLEFKIKSTATYGNSVLDLNVTEASDGEFNEVEINVQDGVVTVIAPQLSAPENVCVDQVYSNAVTLSWDYVEEASGYNVYLNGNKVNEEAVSEPGYTISGLEPLTTYAVYVTAMNVNTESEYEQPIEVTTLAIQYTVDFYSEDGELLESISVDEGGSITPPNAPAKDGFCFDAWRIVSYDSTRGSVFDDFSSITSDLILKASYVEQTVTVSFVDWDGTVLSTQTIPVGESAIAPEEPYRDGYAFVGWDSSFMNIYDDVVIHPLYTELPTLKLAGATLQLENDICVRIRAKADIIDGYYQNVYVVVTQKLEAGKTRTTTVQGVKSEDGSSYFFEYKGVEAKEVGDLMDVTIYGYNNGRLIEGKTQQNYGIMSYCLNQLGKTPAEIGVSEAKAAALKTLLVDLINYASSAQRYFGYKTNALVSSRLTAGQKALASSDSVLNNLTSVTNSKHEVVSNPKVTWNGATLLLLSRTTFRVKATYSGNIENLKLYAKVEGKSYQVTKYESAGSGAYYFYFDDITAYQYETPVDFYFMEGNVKVSNTVRYSIASYASSKLNDSMVGYAVSAMMKYGKSAERYNIAK